MSQEIDGNIIQKDYYTYVFLEHNLKQKKRRKRKTNKLEQEIFFYLFARLELLAAEAVEQKGQEEVEHEEVAHDERRQEDGETDLGTLRPFIRFALDCMTIESIIKSASFILYHIRLGTCAPARSYALILYIYLSICCKAFRWREKKHKTGSAAYVMYVHIANPSDRRVI